MAQAGDVPILLCAQITGAYRPLFHKPGSFDLCSAVRRFIKVYIAY